jgi:hypothetical protein
MSLAKRGINVHLRQKKSRKLVKTRLTPTWKTVFVVAKAVFKKEDLVITTLLDD